jgi:hypothetical protein
MRFEEIAQSADKKQKFNKNNRSAKSPQKFQGVKAPVKKSPASPPKNKDSSAKSLNPSPARGRGAGERGKC